MKKNGFTLIEILVVVAIITILIAILIPALGKAKQMAQKTRAEAEMTHLATTIDAYYSVFHAYPGPASVMNTAGTGNKLSGSQNLALGITFGMFTPPTALPAVSIPNITGTVYASDPTKPIGPTNYGNLKFDGKFEQIAPFFEPTSKQLSSPTSPGNWPPSGVTGAGANNFNFPVFIDPYPDGLPILYFRRTPGVDTPTSVTPYNPNSPASYYVAENKEYIISTLTSSAGTVCSQASSSMVGSGDVHIDSYVRENNVTRGGYILISAGADRLYGKSTTGPIKPSDDIVRVGGN